MAKKKKVKKAAKKKPASKAKKMAVKKSIKKTKKAPAKKKKIASRKNVRKKKPLKSKTGRERKGIIVAVDDQCFWISEGPVLRNLLDLRDALGEINRDQFAHHVNTMKNDFAAWVEGVLCDKKCADKIRKTKTARAMIKSVEQALLEYEV